MVPTTYLVKDIDAVVEESASLSSRKRKNASRHISSFETMKQMQIGHKLNLVFRQSVAEHSEAMEFGGSEAGIKDGNDYGTKYSQEKMYKLPRALKNMLDSLYGNMPNTCHLQYNQLRTVGFIHSGLNSQMITIMDRPTMYISRVNSYKSISIGSHISQFDSVVPAIKLVLKS